MKIKRLMFFGIFALIFLSGLISADFTHAISNSESWEDVYSTMLYANLNNAESDFVVSTSHGSTLLGGISKNNDLMIVSSEDNPYVLNYQSIAESRGFSTVEEMEVESANLELIEEMPDINNFIVVGNSYGYSAVAVTSYAIATNSWVFLADQNNIDEIDSFLSQRNIDNLLLYGYMDTEVSQTLSKYDPEEINTGDRFEDNIEIVEKTLEVNPTNQVVLTNGEFIEKEILKGKNPALFTGKENVPEKIANYIQSSDIEIGVLIGNDLIGAATNIRRSTGINVIVKFARGSRSASSGISQVEGLDLFYLPTANVNLEVYSIKYNKATSQIEITYQSNSNVPLYFSGTLTLNPNSDNVRVGDIDPIFIAPGDYKTVTYEDITLSEDEEMEAEVFTLYGEVDSSLDREIEETFEIETINVLDRCEIEVESLVYNKQEEAFVLKVKNLESTECWVSAELRDVSINGIEQTLGSDAPEKVGPKKSSKILVKENMAEEDIEENSFIDVYAYYGERRDSLVNLAQGRFELSVRTLTTITYSIIVLVLLILSLLAWFVVIRKKEEF